MASSTRKHREKSNYRLYDLSRIMKEDQSQQITLMSRLRHVRAKRIALAAAIVVIIALVVTNGFVDFPSEAAQIFVFDRSKAQPPDQVLQYNNGKLSDQLTLKGSESYSVNIHVIDRSTDLVRWLIYHKSSMLIEATVWAKCTPSYPGLAMVILDSDGLVRGYRFLISASSATLGRRRRIFRMAAITCPSSTPLSISSTMFLPT